MCFRVRVYTVLTKKKSQMIQKDFVMSDTRDGFVFFEPEIYASLCTESHIILWSQNISLPVYGVGHVKG